MRHPRSLPARSACLAAAVVLALLAPAAASAHAELTTSQPADGATLPSPFSGPIVLSFSAALADGSKAELYGSFGKLVAEATVDGPGATMTISLDEPLAPATYEVRWVSVGDDGDLERGTFSFTVEAAAPTPSPTPSPTPTPAASSAPSPSAEPSALPTVGASVTPSPSPADAAAGTGDVILPIVVALVVVGAGGAYLFSRRRGAIR